MSSVNTNYLLDLDGAKTLYSEIIKDVDDKIGNITLKVDSEDDISDLTSNDLVGVSNIIVNFE